MAQPRSDVDLSGFGLEKVQQIGKGRFASAQVVREIDTGRVSVAKCVSLAAVLDEHEQELAKQEVFLLQELKHPLIVSYRDSFLIEGANMLIIVMEFCEGGDLRKVVRANSEVGERLPEARILNWFVQVAVALQYIHSEKVLHRDLKTSNIFLCNADANLVKLGDFGISRILEGTTDAAVTMVGTPYYMSPEVCRNEPYGMKSDIWALGCVLYELCMLRFAFESSSLHGLVYKIVTGLYEPIPSSYSPEINEILGRLLDKQAHSRPSATEILQADVCKRYVEQVANSGVHVESVVDAAASGQQADDAQARRRHIGRSTTLTLETTSQIPPTDERLLQDPRVRLLVLASRVRRRLSARRLNWVSELGVYDKHGDGHLTQDAMQGALVDLKLGLSRDEAKTFVQALAAEGGVSAAGRVDLKIFEQTLSEGMSALQVTSLEALVLRLVNRGYDRVLLALRPKDEGSKFVSQAVFLETLQALLVPGSALKPYEAEAFLMLSDKDPDGNIDIQLFLEEYEPVSPPAQAFDTCTSSDFRCS